MLTVTSVEVTFIKEDWIGEQATLHMCATRFCKHDGHLLKKLAAKFTWKSIVFNWFVSQHVFNGLFPATK